MPIYLSLLMDTQICTNISMLLYDTHVSVLLPSVHLGDGNNCSFQPQGERSCIFPEDPGQVCFIGSLADDRNHLLINVLLLSLVFTTKKFVRGTKLELYSILDSF